MTGMTMYMFDDPDDFIGAVQDLRKVMGDRPKRRTRGKGRFKTQEEDLRKWRDLTKQWKIRDSKTKRKVYT